MFEKSNPLLDSLSISWVIDALFDIGAGDDGFPTSSSLSIIALFLCGDEDVDSTTLMRQYNFDDSSLSVALSSSLSIISSVCAAPPICARNTLLKLLNRRAQSDVELCSIIRRQQQNSRSHERQIDVRSMV